MWILFPMLHGKHNLACGYKCKFSLFSASGRSWQHKAHIADFNFYYKPKAKCCFPMVGRTLVFFAMSPGLIFIKVIFWMTFLSIFKFCYTSNGFWHIFQVVLLVIFCSFRTYAFRCRPIAKNEALKQHIFTSRFWNCKFSYLKCRKSTRR